MTSHGLRTLYANVGLVLAVVLTLTGFAPALPHDCQHHAGSGHAGHAGHGGGSDHVAAMSMPCWLQPPSAPRDKNGCRCNDAKAPTATLAPVLVFASSTTRVIAIRPRFSAALPAAQFDSLAPVAHRQPWPTAPPAAA